MAPHPWVTEARQRDRFGVELVGLRGRTGGLGGYLTYDQPAPVVLEAARVADALGLDIFVADDMVSAKAPQTFVMLGALAAITSHVRLGTLVTSPTHHYPTHLARAFSDLDHLSNGRMILGLGIAAGFDTFTPWNKSELSEWLGIPYLAPRELQDRQAEAIEIIERLWKEETVSYDGHYYQLHSIDGGPVPVQQPRPPILIGGTGTRTLAQVARYADACNFAFISDVGERLEVLKRHCEKLDRPFEDILITEAHFMVLAETERELDAKKRKVAWPEYFAHRDELGIPAAGTPESVSAFFQQRFDAGVEYMIVVLFDTADHETMQLLASKVIPNFT